MDITDNIQADTQQMTIEEMRAKWESLRATIAEREARTKEKRRETVKVDAQLRQKRKEIRTIEKAERHKQRVEDNEKRIEDFKKVILNIGEGFGRKAKKLAHEIVYEAAQKDNIIFSYKRVLEKIDNIYGEKIDKLNEEISILQRQQENSYIIEKELREEKKHYNVEISEMLREHKKASKGCDEKAIRNIEKGLNLLKAEMLKFLGKERDAKTTSGMIDRMSKAVNQVISAQVQTTGQVISRQNSNRVEQKKAITYKSGSKIIEELNEKLQEQQQLRDNLDEQIRQLEKRVYFEEMQVQANTLLAKLSEAASETIKKNQVRAEEIVEKEKKEETEQKADTAKVEGIEETNKSFKERIEEKKKFRNSIDKTIEELENEIARKIVISDREIIARMNVAASQVTRGIVIRQPIYREEHVKSTTKVKPKKQEEIATIDISEEEIIEEFDKRIQNERNNRDDIDNRIEDIRKEISKINNDREDEREKVATVKENRLTEVGGNKIWKKVGVFLFNKINGVNKFKTEIGKIKDSIDQSIEGLSKIKKQFEENVIQKKRDKMALDKLNLEIENERKKSREENPEQKKHYYGVGGFSILD